MIYPTNDYILNVYAPIREFKGRVTIDLLGEVNTYDDNTIINMKILEELSILNDTVPANEVQLTMDNSNGDFDLLTLSNMPQIIASKPVITTELGLVYEGDKFTFDSGVRYIRDWINGNSVNTTNYWNEIKAYSNTGVNRCQGIIATTNGSMTNVANITDNDGSTYAYAWGQAGGVYAQIDLGAIYTDIEYIQVIHYYLDGRTFYGAKTEISTDGINWTVLRDSAIEGDYPETSQGQVFNPPKGEVIEWIPTGKFFLTSWKNDITNKIISMVGNDYFALFSDISFSPTATTNLKTLAQEVLTAGGVALADQIIDDSLATITVNPFPNRISVREALQYIGIASRSAVFQDRAGRINIIPFKTLDVAGNYIMYPRQTNHFLNFPNTTYPLYPLVGTGAGMKFIDFDQMYDTPEISLEKSIYELIVVSYEDGWTVENINHNPALAGTNGISFKIDNPLVNSGAMAKSIAEWFFKESNYNAIYRTKWRANPILECSDMILVEDSFNAQKQTRIFRQEFTYAGYLEGFTESRGGV